jgi:two-component system sensor histidine kinase RegB
VARTLGGRVAVRNRAEGGAIVSIALPLAAVVLEEEDDDEAIDDTIAMTGTKSP